jgi:energy-converting hydrogenase Eha subunit E
MRRTTPVATYLGIATTGVGFVLIALAWNGAANLDYVQGQFPFLLSGGLTGLSLIVIGVTVMVIQALRQDAVERALQLEELHATVTQLAGLLAPPDAYDPVVSGEYRPRPRRSNGNDNEAVVTGTAAGGASWQQSS